MSLAITAARTGTASRNRLPILLAGSAAALLAGFVYFNTLDNPFFYDDYRTVADNPTLTQPFNALAVVLYDRTRPLTNLSFAFEQTLWRGRPEPFRFHVTNLVLHVVCVVLLFMITATAGKYGSHPPGTLAAFCAGALLAVHPMMTEAVSYISGRSELVSAAAFLGALLCARRWMGGSGRRWLGGTIALWAAAVAAKETAAILPVVLIAANRLWPDAGTAIERRHRLFRVLVPLLVVTAAIGVARVAFLAWVEYPGRVAIQWHYIPLALDVVRRYLILLVFPVGQTVFHAVSPVRPFEPRLFAALAVVGVLVAVAWRARRTEPSVALGIVWFLLALVPSSILIVLDQGEPMAERRVYLASCGLFLAAGTLLGRANAGLSRSPLKRAIQPALAIVIASFAAETFVRNQLWGDPVALWREAAERAPDHYRPRLLLGEALHHAGRIDEAIVQLQTVVAMKPGEPLGHLKLGESLAATGQIGPARWHAAEALRLDRSSAVASRLLDTLNDAPRPAAAPDVTRR